jgi:hypothetical protein
MASVDWTSVAGRVGILKDCASIADALDRAGELPDRDELRARLHRVQASEWTKLVGLLGLDYRQQGH